MLRSLCAAILMVGSASLCAQAPAVTVIKAGALLNPADGKVTQNATIIVRGENIEQINPAQTPAGAKVVDLSGYTVLPGLICVNDVGKGELTVNPIVDPPLYADFIVIAPARRTLSTPARLFLERFEADLVETEKKLAGLLRVERTKRSK